jgi:uncharacterized protein
LAKAAAKAKVAVASRSAASLWLDRTALTMKRIMRGRPALGAAVPYKERRTVMTAGGTLEVPVLTTGQQLQRMVELIFLYGLMPFAMTILVHGEKVPLFVALLPVLALVLLLLAVDKTFSFRQELGRLPDLPTLASILIIFAVGGFAATLYAADVKPGWFMEFPRSRPELWAKIMLLYPFASVAAQEFVYRTFFFHRYGVLFGRHKWLAILVNGVFFGLAHVVVGTQFAVVSTFFTGILFAARYAATRSFWAVFLEHTLWGWLVFTVGLGRYFFTGVSNV